MHEYKHYLDYAKYGLQGYLSIKVKDRDKHTTISFQKIIVSLLNNRYREKVIILGCFHV